MRDTVERGTPEQVASVQMTSADWEELERLSRKAAWYERYKYGNEHNYDYLIGVSMYASRMM